MDKTISHCKLSQSILPNVHPSHIMDSKGNPKPKGSMTRQEYAEHRKSKGLVGGYATISKYVNEGKISSVNGKYIYPEIADNEWRMFIKSEHLPIEDRPDPINISELLSDDEDIPDRRVSEARIAAIKAIKEQLSLDELQGELVKVSDVYDQLYSIMVTLRESMLNIPSRYAPELASLTDVSDIENLLDAAIREQLGSTATMIKRSKILSNAND